MEIKYPNKKNKSAYTTIKSKTRNLKKSHLGVSFEDAINESNEYYYNNNLAVIYKKPTPIQVVRVEYPSRNKSKIVEAYYKIPSTTDYNGIYKGKHIDFEAKSCSEKSFSFGRIYTHQIEHLKKINDHGGIAFLLIEFSSEQKVFILPIDILFSLYQESLNGGRKSIPLEIFEKYGILVKTGFLPRVDYLQAIEKKYF